MKGSLRALVVAAGLASVTALGNVALAEQTGAAPGAAGEYGHGCPKGKEARHGKHFLKRLADKLGMSPAQRTQAKEVLDASRSQAKPLMASLKQERHQLRDLIHSGTADEAAVRAQSAKVAALQSDLAVQRAQTVRKLMALLTPEQQVKLKELKAKWGAKHRDHGMEQE
ncbi:periplasmic protein CpxP [Geomonas limicola]|uniref:Periplasmic protein CpxP n=1 Tax=Geomonas limicola TaxID=2740186 RepID=A0A6V8N5S7_9BACT|nr:Spy/CpxP family protein refolding chaperone [Geomonas limicola]GFO67177.1 periplasmic protein CpxP [Geomonas limicola]